jgi:hypothetical protein
MNEWILIGSIALFLGIRAASFIRFWRTPFYFGADKFFGLPLAPDVSRPLLRRYRSRLMLVYLPDALCAVAAYLWGGLIGLAFEQIAGAIVTRLCQTLVAIHTIRQTKLLAAEGSWKPVASVALSLKTRRLRDYLDLRFELALPLFTVASLAIVASYFRHGSATSGPAGLVRELAIAALAIYVQLGGLLAKHALVRWRMWLPGERTETYLRWREAVLNYFLWACDYLRAMLTVAIVSFVLFANLRAAGPREAILPLAAAVAVGIIVCGAAGLGTRRRRLKRLWNELQPLEDFSSPPQKIDSREFFLGGLCYCNADNPALFVPGPLVYAINVANNRTYLYLAYVAGFVLLGMWCISVPH